MSDGPIDIRPDDLAAVRKILRDVLPRDAKVWVFGSRATWTTRDSSDLDLAIDAGRALTRKEETALQDAFEESDLPYKVDVADMVTVSEKFREIIERDRVELSIRKSWRESAAMSEWRETTWGEEISLEYGKGIRGYSDATGPYRVFGSNGPVGWTSEALAPGPGVILGRKGAYRGVQYSKEPFFVIDTAYFVVPKSDLDMRWLYYSIIYYKLGEIDDGSPIPSTTRAAVYVRDLMVPPPAEQRAIAHILGTLDDKIELNRRMNETLEATARAIFKDWFVDFGPVRAKMGGREPYLAQDIWSLFPDKLDDEGKPEGWESKPLTEFISIIGGGTPKTSNTDFWGGPIPWFSVTDTPAKGSVFVTATEKTITEEGLNGSSARLIPKGTTIISARGTVGNLAIAGCEMTFNQSCYGLKGTAHVGDYAAYLFAQNMVKRLQVMAHGSVFSTITRQTFESLSQSMPTPSVLSAFEDAVSPLFEKILANVKESHILAQTRDLLLQKLMSGEIRLREAEKAVEAVA